jgi:PIN domain nuclease of toxin-antitoxin system
MTVYVLDSSALIRFLDKEAGFHRVKSVLKDCVAGRVQVSISAVQWGEVAGNLRKRFGASGEIRIMNSLLPSEARVVAATAERAVHAAEIKVDRGIAYADAFAVDLAMDSPGHVLVTADYGFKSVEDLARIELLPAK